MMQSHQSTTMARMIPPECATHTESGAEVVPEVWLALSSGNCHILWQMDSVLFYTRNAESLADAYENVAPERIHAHWSHLIPKVASAVLDVGAGSGRDAAWLASQGHEVVAVEPSPGMRAVAARLHADSRIRWVDDRLPGLERVHRMDLSFGLILVGAVWMHVAPALRERAFRKLCGLLRPGGVLVLSLRHGPFSDSRKGYAVSADELHHLAKRYALEAVFEQRSADSLARPGVWWEWLAFRLRDDGTGALPLLRHVIVNDRKSATYKLALLRALLRVADGARGAVESRDAAYVYVPLGLVALYWIRLFKPLVLSADMLQRPKQNSLGFLTEAFRALEPVSPYDLTVGREFDDVVSLKLSVAIGQVCRHIQRMPAHFMTHPGTETPVFPVEFRDMPRAIDFRLDLEFLGRYGTIAVPVHIWSAMMHHASWIEPAIVNEWVGLMRGYDEAAGRQRPVDEYVRALTWLEAERNTTEVRRIVDGVRRSGRRVHCIWTGRRLTEDFAVDHCFPFSYWPNNDLWNLLPCSPRANGQKSDRLPSAHLLAAAADQLGSWWHDAHIATPRVVRFLNEAHMALPSFSGSDTARLFAAVQEQRGRLRVDQQIAEWDGLRHTPHH